MTHGFEAPEILLIALLAVALFAGPKLPEIARSLGASLRIFTTRSRRAPDTDADEAPF